MRTELPEKWYVVRTPENAQELNCWANGVCEFPEEWNRIGPIIYYIGIFCQWLSKILSTEYWQSIIQGAAAITIFGCFIWTIGYFFLYLLSWVKHEIWLNKRDKEQGK